jgi:flagellar basal-body rod protein FlgB
MSLFDTTQSVLERAIQGAGMRHQVLADNLANANTPGYQRKDVDFESTLAAALEGGSATVNNASFTPETDTASVARADGNSVDVDVEAAKLSENGLQYQSLVQVAAARIDILQSAIGVR